MSKNAALLQKNISNFARTVPRTQGRELRGMISLIHREATETALRAVQSGTWRTVFVDAAASATSTSFHLPNGSVVNPWAGGFTLTAIDGEGRIVAHVANPKGEAYEIYGTDLAPYSLSKAVMRLHLEKLAWRGGIGTPANFEQLKRCLPADRPIFQGDAVATEFWVKPSPEKIFIGASGCELDSHYRDALLPEGLRREALGKPAVDFIAGRMDTVFARLVANILAETEGGQSRVMSEPEWLSQLRTSH